MVLFAALLFIVLVVCCRLYNGVTTPNNSDENLDSQNSREEAKDIQYVLCNCGHVIHSLLMGNLPV